MPERFEPGPPVPEDATERETLDRDLSAKEREFRSWADGQGIPPEAYLMKRKTEAVKDWETREIGILVDARYYSRVRAWLEQSPQTQVDYSWAGRMAAYDLTPEGWYRPGSGFRDFAFIERNENGERVVRTHHAEFKKFASEHGTTLPDAAEVQRRIDTVDRAAYERALATIEERFQGADAETERSLAALKGKVECALLFMRIGVEEPQEEYNIDRGERLTDQETSYNDLVYNADDFLSAEDYEKAGIPPQDRLLFVDGKRMEELCRQFGEQLLKKGVYR